MECPKPIYQDCDTAFIKTCLGAPEYNDGAFDTLRHLRRVPAVFMAYFQRYRALHCQDGIPCRTCRLEMAKDFREVGENISHLYRCEQTDVINDYVSVSFLCPTGHSHECLQHHRRRRVDTRRSLEGTQQILEPSRHRTNAKGHPRVLSKPTHHPICKASS